MKKVIFIFVLLFLSYGVSVDVSVAQQWTVYTTADGLVGNRIRAIREDEKGYLWFATSNGASRYDGGHFQNLNMTNGLSSDNIYFLLVDKRGNLWFATDSGVSKYNGVEFQDFYPDRFVDNLVHFMLEDQQGNLWFATDSGVSRYNGVEFQDFYPDRFVDNPVNFMLEDQQGNLWFGTEKGIYKYTMEKLQWFDADGLAGISVILEDQEGHLWFGTENGVSKYDGQKFQNFTARDGLVNNSILSMLQDSGGNLWFGTRTGISKYNGKGFQNFKKINDTALKFVRSIWEDSDENLWFGTANGTCKYTVENLHPLKKADGLAGIRVILKDQEDNLWFGTENGVSKYDGAEFKNFMVGSRILSMLQDSRGNLWIGTLAGIHKNLTPINEVNTAVIAILEDKGNLWFVTAEGVGVYNGTTFQLVFTIEDVSEMFMDSRGNLWIGSMTDGIYKYELDGKDQKHYTDADGLKNNRITWILETQDGTLWFGLENEGVCRYDYNDDSFRHFTSESITVALEDSTGNLWFGTYEGVMKNDESQRITRAHGLISNYVTSILSDRAGNLWFGTDKGVSKYDGTNFQNIPLEEYLTFGSIDTIFEDSKGAMWFITTNGGVIKYTAPAKEICPRIHLTQIEADRIYPDFDKIKIPSTTKHVTFEYQGISFKTKPDKMRYTYQLEGHDKNWLSTDKSRTHHYEQLKPGHYQFKVKAIDKDLHYSDPPATVDINIFRPWYLTPQFFISIIFGGICLLGGGGYLIVQLNKQRQIAVQLRETLRKQEEAELVQAAKMESLHQLVSGVAHEINNPIGAISSNNDISSRTIVKIKEILTEELKENRQLSRTLAALETVNQSSEIASERVAKIVANLRSFVRLDEAEWQVADIHEGIDNALALMEMEPEFKNRIKVTADYGDIPRIYCSPSSLNQVFMNLFKNAFEAIEGEGEIQIRTSAQQGYVKIEISDTGKGIPAEDTNRIFDPGFTTKGVKVGVGLGLSICHKIIVDEHKGHIGVSNELGNGTTFTIMLPLLKGEGRSERSLSRSVAEGGRKEK